VLTILQEELIESDATVRDEYREYKKRVPYRIIPYIWWANARIRDNRTSLFPRVCLQFHISN
jgi:hypothetical protein